MKSVGESRWGAEGGPSVSAQRVRASLLRAVGPTSNTYTSPGWNKSKILANGI